MLSGLLHKSCQPSPCNCNKVKEFWLAMKNWLRIQANVIHLTIKNVIFSKQENNELLNYILLLGKYFIYKTKFLANSIRLENFIIYLKRKYQNEKYISKIHNKQNKFQAKWSLLKLINISLSIMYMYYMQKLIK